MYISKENIFLILYQVHDYQNWKSLADPLLLAAITGSAATKMKFSQALCDFWLKQEPRMAFQCTFWHVKESYVFPSFQRAEAEVRMFNLVLLERIVQFELSKDTIKTRKWAKWSRFTEMSSTLTGCSKQRLTVQRPMWSSVPARWASPG